jgi:DNA mismatch repair protein MutL
MGESLRGTNTTDEESAGIPSARIRLLPDALVDQIAAGEVVERPASVVKELVENALDAGARRIRVEVRDGGAALVTVTDDGGGMTPEDARMALQRHATSKLASAADLMRINSFGFRGEALPAIASVARLRLLTRPHGAATGHEIRVESGRVMLEREAGVPEGTRIEVADLFAGVPARRKFLKKSGTEWGHVADWLGRLALALPGVHFEVQRDDRPALVWPATTRMLDRIAAVLSESEARALVPIEWEEKAGHVQAFLSAPDRSHANASGLYLYVNGRPVRDRLLRHALLEAYRDLLPRGRHPSAVVFLTVAPDQVDVNVHPAKWEVRFVDAQGVHQLLRHAVREAMTSRTWLARGAAPQLRPEAVSRVAEPGQDDWIFAGRTPKSPNAGQGGAFGSPDVVESEHLRFAELRLLGQLHASYLLAEGPQGLLLVDQHAAHERVLYERLRADWLGRGVERQGLLAVISVDLEPLALEALDENADVVARLGFEIERFGERALLVRAIPALLAGQDPTALIRSLAEELESPDPREAGGGSESRLLQAADRALASLACHSARRFGDVLPAAEQQAILSALDTIPWAPTCPHGRPVATSYELPEIERRFRRR